MQIVVGFSDLITPKLLKNPSGENHSKLKASSGTPSAPATENGITNKNEIMVCITGNQDQRSYGEI